MTAFTDINTAGEDLLEAMAGESFTYKASPSASNTFSGLVGLMNDAPIDYQFADGSIRKIEQLTVVTSKAQWETAGVVPGQRGVITYNGTAYSIDRVGGSANAIDPAYELVCKVLT